ncbi:MAG: M48 family metallopeptidase [Dehalococcoidia bacterium]
MDDTSQAPLERVLIWDQIGANKWRTVLLIVGFVVFVALFFAAIGTVVSTYAGTSPSVDPKLTIQIAIASALIATAVGILMYFVSTATVLAISGAHEATKAEEPELYRVVENLSIGSGLPMPKVWVMEDSAPNAFATGRDPQNAHVAATRGLIEKLDKSELEAVMAHEMSHIGNYDTRIMTTVAVVVGLVALASDLMLRFTWYGAGARQGNKGKGENALALIILAVAVLFLILSPFIASAMRFALSRQREYLADASGALLCRNPGALASALEKIAADPEPLEVANKATAHMYIENPLKEHKSFLNNLFATHPPVDERIRLLRAMGG